MLGIETKLSMAYYPQIDRQMERTNQELEQYLRIYVDYKQNNWLEQLAMAEFVFNNKVHTSTKLSLFKINYRRKPRMGFDIKKKEKNIKVEESVKKMKDKHEKVKIVLIKLQEEMKRQGDKNRKEVEEYRVGDKILISTKDFPIELIKRAMRKLMEKYIRPYMIKKIVLENTVELELPVLLKIHPVINMRRIVKYQEQTERQKKISFPLIEIEREKEYEVEKILDQ